MESIYIEMGSSQSHTFRLYSQSDFQIHSRSQHHLSYSPNSHLEPFLNSKRHSRFTDHNNSLYPSSQISVTFQLQSFLTKSHSISCASYHFLPGLSILNLSHFRSRCLPVAFHQGRFKLINIFHLPTDDLNPLPTLLFPSYQILPRNVEVQFWVGIVITRSDLRYVNWD